jgi:hypothetical protein
MILGWINDRRDDEKQQREWSVLKSKAKDNAEAQRSTEDRREKPR